MRLQIERKDAIIKPDNNRVFARFFFNGNERAEVLISKILQMPEDQVEMLLNQILREFSKRHRSISGILKRHYTNVKPIVDRLSTQKISEWRKFVIGAYFTMEYALESAALFNPSMVEDPDQTGLEEGQKRVIISLRATGEGHISSLVFRRAIICRKGGIILLDTGNQIAEAERIRNHEYEKKDIINKLISMDIPQEHYSRVLDFLPEKFTYDQIQEAIRLTKKNNTLNVMEQQKALDEILWLADSHTEIQFSIDTDLSERVIFPISKFEKKGIEDARFVKFHYNSGKTCYFGVYTAYDGYTILPKLIETQDFYTFKIFPLHGAFAVDKNLALFPRKIKGKYTMISRIDGVNNYIMSSSNLYQWDHAQKIAEPTFPWELVQIGSGGSPIETEQGWLLITHGVGPLRKYCLGALLLDLNNPLKIIGRLKEPLLLPDEDERSGYVPNVVYTCGSLLCHDELLIPYAMSDYASSFACVNINDLLAALSH